MPRYCQFKLSSPHKCDGISSRQTILFLVWGHHCDYSITTPNVSVRIYDLASKEDKRQFIVIWMKANISLYQSYIRTFTNHSLENQPPRWVDHLNTTCFSTY
jgi:hypothetical protein